MFFADILTFSGIRDKGRSVNKLNNNIQKITDWTHKCKAGFNPDPIKKIQEVLFPDKSNKPPQLILKFNKETAVAVTIQRRLGLYIDEKLDFNFYVI